MRLAFILAAVACGSLAIAGRMLVLPWLHWVFKPATMLVIIALAATLGRPSLLRTLVLVALAVSLVGDILLMLPIRGFVAGLAVFIVALLIYATAFTKEGAIQWYHAAALPVLAVALFFVLRPLWPHLGSLKIPIALYGAVSSATIVAAAVRGHPLGVLGAALFTLSDTLLAYARFSEHHVPYPLELGTYFAAQLLFALSVVI